ncbi:MAG TPA: hypothetical protein VF116_05505 [Ktedonobacterales bacterium]
MEHTTTRPDEMSALTRDDDTPMSQRSSPDEMPCPVCGHPMPDLKGGKASICPVCGFKDSCCY